MRQPQPFSTFKAHCCQCNKWAVLSISGKLITGSTDWANGTVARLRLAEQSTAKTAYRYAMASGDIWPEQATARLSSGVIYRFGFQHRKQPERCQDLSLNDPHSCSASSYTWTSIFNGALSEGFFSSPTWAAPGCRLQGVRISSPIHHLLLLSPPTPLAPASCSSAVYVWLCLSGVAACLTLWDSALAVSRGCGWYILGGFGSSAELQEGAWEEGTPITKVDLRIALSVAHGRMLAWLCGGDSQTPGTNHPELLGRTGLHCVCLVL